MAATLEMPLRRKETELQVLLVELNEINFAFVRRYIEFGELPHLAQLMEAHGLSETVSEQSYEELEPWIQWVTAHTGMPFCDHGVFRLGDIVEQDIEQLWEALERQGLSVGAISPMNAKNRTHEAAFFVPDPWTETRPTATPLLRRLHSALRQAVNDNAKAHLAPSSIASLLAGTVRYARPDNYGSYAELLIASRRHPWAKAMFLDLLLADIFIGETRRTCPDFASLFLNAGAHIQHHYMFNSPAYGGELRNPEWFIGADQDPVGEIYRLYDRVVGQIKRAFPAARLMLATGLHQDPHPEIVYYWRLKSHADFLHKIGAPFRTVKPRMSRDFVVECDSDAQASVAERVLRSVKSQNGYDVFDVDNRGTDLFVVLKWPYDIPGDMEYLASGCRYHSLRDEVAFVAIKNGQHNGVGYFLDTGVGVQDATPLFPLAELPDRVSAALGVRWLASNRAA